MAAPPDDERRAQAVSNSSASVSPNSVCDQPTHDDTLGFKPYVEAVCVFLTHKDTVPPLTLSVEGSWGSGKSSFMLQLEDRLNPWKRKQGKPGVGNEIGNDAKPPQKPNVKTVWFNAWRHDKEDELWAAFALNFTNQLAALVPWWKRWLLHLKLSYLRFDWGRGWFELAKFSVLAALFLLVGISAALRFDSILLQLQSRASTGQLEESLLTVLLGGGGLAAYLLLGFALVRKITDVIGNPLQVQLTRYIQDPKYETRTAFVETFHSDFKRIVKTYAEGCNVFVFVDDLDRCDVPKAAELMQALNLLISEDLPVFYILGLDREKIAAGLAAKYEKLLPYLSSYGSGDSSNGATGTEFGYMYLEKFIQLPFLVPQPAEKDVDKLLDSLGARPQNADKSSSPPPQVDPGLLVSLSADSDSVRDIVKMVAPSFEYNPRRLKQFVNLFRLRALLASQTGLFGVPRDNQFDPLTFEQLGKLVAIILRWPLLLVDVERRPGLLGILQTYSWNPKSVGEVGSLNQRDSMLEFWLSKKNLMDLISFPSTYGRAPSEADALKYGLHRIDLERFLQISPMVRGRENAGTSPATEDHARTQLNPAFVPNAPPETAGYSQAADDDIEGHAPPRGEASESSYPEETESANYESPAVNSSADSQQHRISRREAARKMKK